MGQMGSTMHGFMFMFNNDNTKPCWLCKTCVHMYSSHELNMALLLMQVHDSFPLLVLVQHSAVIQGFQRTLAVVA